MRHLISNNRLMAITAVVFLVAGLLIGYSVKDFMWFARSGSILVGIGVALFSRPAVIGQEIRFSVIKLETGLGHNDPAHYHRLGESVPSWVIQDRESRLAVGVLAPIITFIGTIIWGFGDLLNKVSFFNG